MNNLPGDPSPSPKPEAVGGEAVVEASGSRSWRWPSYRIASFYFLRLLGVVYLIAFVSLWVQMDGLIGRNGILPAGPWLDQIRDRVGSAVYEHLPTLCWLNTSDMFLHVLCGSGVVFSALLIVGLVPALCTPLLWLLYLSLTVAGQIFLGYQWDNLLLEAGFLAIFLSPLVLRSRLATDPPPSRVAVFLVQCLLFKLMFSSGYVKLRSGDSAWWDLTALTYHYWTQCLPTWVAWYADKLPLGFQKFSCAVMYFIELGLPFFVWGPGRILRRIAFAGLVGFQCLIAITGNYTFFNLLTAALCLVILDDRCFHAKWAELPASRPRYHWLVWPAAIPILLVSMMIFSGTIGIRVAWPRWTMELYEWVSPFRTINSYGLFAVMTKSRHEIVVEGSADGRTWLAYEFKCKPGDVMRAPPFVAPHQPRLDWQMWFAALGNYRGNPWFSNFLVRLLQGSPEVLARLDKNPFPDAPPRLMRAVIYDYRFTNAEERRKTGAWWRREIKGLYCMPMQLNDYGQP